MDSDEVKSKYGELTLIQLREELRKRGAKVAGRKKELVERLDAYDRNYNFGKNTEADITEYIMTTPEESTYRDLHSGHSIPDMTMDNIDTYLQPLNKSLSKESVNLVNDRFLRFLKTSTSADGKLFVKTQCWAEMKKNVKYNVDISMDENGLVEECQCECGSGMGPEAHCKHVNALLYALFKFSTTGAVITEETCTQRLQTFHQVPKHKGSPIKACDLKLAKQKKRSSYSNTVKPLNFDPRPNKRRKVSAYNGYFRNTCLNFPEIGKMPIAQLYVPANTYAIAIDHDYTKENPEQAFLRHVELTDISDNRIAEIERNTREQSYSKAWLQIRCFRLNSSTFGRICKLTDRTDKVKYAASLTTRTDIKSAAIKHGRKYEKVAVNKFRSETSLAVTKCGSCIYKDHPYIAASPDGLIRDDATLEVKCPFTSKDKTISPITVPYLILDTNDRLTLRPSHDYFYQVQGQLLCTNRQLCYFCVYTHQDFKIIKIHRDEKFIKDMLVRLQAFFKDYFRQAVLDNFFYRNYRKHAFQESSF